MSRAKDIKKEMAALVGQRARLARMERAESGTSDTEVWKHICVIGAPGAGKSAPDAWSRALNQGRRSGIERSR